MKRIWNTTKDFGMLRKNLERYEEFGTLKRIWNATKEFEPPINRLDFWDHS